MAGSSFGNIFRITTWGESHGKGVGVVVDGCPAGLPLTEADIQQYLNRRKPGQSRFSTPRKEDDAVEILSGIFEGRTTGTPISMVIYNKTQRSQDYSEIASSGRETIGRVAGGAVAAKLLGELGIQLQAYTKAIGPVTCETFDTEEIWNNSLYMPDAAAAARAQDYLNACMEQKDSVGGIIECAVDGLPVGLGDPVFEKLSANLAKAICSIGAVKGFEIGDGFAVSAAKGSTNNDAFHMTTDGTVEKLTNHAGGILGGISDGSRLTLRAAIKPTPSIASAQHTVNRSGEDITCEIKGRHDPIIVPRAVVVVETMTSLVIADALLMGMSAKLDNVKKIWSK